MRKNVSVTPEADDGVGAGGDGAAAVELVKAQGHRVDQHGAEVEREVGAVATVAQRGEAALVGVERHLLEGDASTGAPLGAHVDWAEPHAGLWPRREVCLEVAGREQLQVAFDSRDEGRDGGELGHVTELQLERERARRFPVRRREQANPEANVSRFSDARTDT